MVPRVGRSRVVLRVGRSRVVRYRRVGPMMESGRMAPKVGGCRIALNCQVPARRNVLWLQQALPP